jgi:hypothetical protein
MTKKEPHQKQILRFAQDDNIKKTDFSMPLGMTQLFVALQGKCMGPSPRLG